MARILFFLFILFSVIEIILFVLIGRVVDVWLILLFILLTSLLGIYLAKYQGIGIINRARQEMAHGRVPTEEMFDGIAIIIGAILLILPGFFTDFLGLLLLIPFTRIPIKIWLQQVIKEKVKNGNIYIYRRF